ncbi:Exocyst complex subunit Exo70, C-terminal [Dillenia turbinata]|uniref:Exocyst subunit Exo70 family protein n=1 Tax=Dillenia turbinata TaxID=194707 RepID=A0AAN8V9F5_9MAGN
MVLSITPKREELTTMSKRVTPSHLFSPSGTPSTPHSIPPPTPLHHPLSETMVEETLEEANKIITKWDSSSNSCTRITFLFTPDNRKEAQRYLKSVMQLRKSMHFLVSVRSHSDLLILSQNLMQIAMKRLEKEFYQILSTNRNKLDPESVSSKSEYSESENEFYQSSEIVEVEAVSDIIMSDLKSIADCMTSCGYGHECVQIYKTIRRSIVDEGLHKLGIKKFRSSQINQMEWRALEDEIKKWLCGVKIVVRTLFTRERILCDHVFSASEATRESCFTDVCKEGGLTLLHFPEQVAKSKKTRDKIFQLMNLYELLTGLLLEIESIFRFQSTLPVRSQAHSSMTKLGDSIHAILHDFETSIRKEHSKTPAMGGGIHPLTRSSCEFMTRISDHALVLSKIDSESSSPSKFPMPTSYFSIPSSYSSPYAAASTRLAWMILVLLCKLETKAELYKDVSLSYIFLANNLRFILSAVRSSSLKFLLGNEWIAKQQKKVNQYVINYEATAWGRVLNLIPDEESPSTLSNRQISEFFLRFNSLFEEVYRKQTSWIVEDTKLRKEIKVLVASKLVVRYRRFYEKYKEIMREERGMEAVVRFAPEDLENHMSYLFLGTAVSGSWSSSASSDSSSSVSSGRGWYRAGELIASRCRLGECISENQRAVPLSKFGRTPSDETCSQYRNFLRCVIELRLETRLLQILVSQFLPLPCLRPIGKDTTFCCQHLPVRPFNNIFVATISSLISEERDAKLYICKKLKSFELFYMGDDKHT